MSNFLVFIYMDQSSPHYDQMHLGTCESFAYGRTIPKYFDSLLHFLPTARISGAPVALLHTERASVNPTRFKQMHLRVLLDYYFIHLVNYANQLDADIFKVLHTCHTNKYSAPDVTTLFKGQGNPRENELLQQMLTLLAEVPLKIEQTYIDNEMNEDLPGIVRTAIDRGTPVLFEFNFKKDKVRHVTDCVKMTKDHLYLRSAWPSQEIHTMALADMESTSFTFAGYEDAMVDFIDIFKCGRTYDVQEYRDKHPKLIARLKQQLSELVQAFQMTERGTVPMPNCALSQSSSSISSARAVYRGNRCDLVYRVLKVVFGVTDADIAHIKTICRCPSLLGWVKMAKTKFAGLALEEFSLKLNKAVSLVEQNEINHRIDTTAKFKKHLEKLRETRVINKRLYTRVKNLTRKGRSVPPLPELLTMIEDQNTPLGDHLKNWLALKTKII